MTVGERIKEIRTKLGMSQVSFAEKINVSKQTLYKYENNIITNIPSDKIEAVAKIGNVSPAYLMGWDELLEKQKKDRKEFPRQWNIHFFDKEMLISFSQLTDGNKKRCISYVEKLLSTQKMEEELQAANSRGATAEQKAHADNLMMDSKEWE